MNQHNWKTEAGLLFAVLVWGVNFPVIKSALEVMPPFVVNALRFTVSAAVLGAAYYVESRRTGERLTDTVRLYWKEIVGLGILSYIVYQLLFIFGIERTLAGNAALIMASSPLWTATVGHGFGFEHVSRAAWAGLGVCLLGTAVVVVGGTELFGGTQKIGFSSDTFAGNVLMLGAAAMWGGYTAFSKPVLRRIPPASLAFLGLAVALPFLYALAVPEWGTVRWEGVDAWVWLALLFSGGLSTGLTLVIWNVAVKKVGAAQTSAYSNLVPFVAVLASVLIRHEALPAVQILGGALIIGGLLLTRRARRMVSVAPAPPAVVPEPPVAGR